MPTFELNLSDDVYAEFQQLADQEFVSEEQAAEELISSGIDAYNVTIVDDDPHDEMLDGAENNMFDTAQDPGSIEDDRL
ncbi:hypothetical protein GRS48_12365 [Halorubrum sp. JWXQ-INN 858]|uniref:hypothetical protein n=1 Tax=Halorubrum sp. JWXQ-INN 858 TaxID=2690782 RepID=UPI0013571748|nr:hypothetical protein [Halorubrum sp. JWXQ-INN 858]MWV65608.1 hypothetical protein [Halorubrum sp. JWXQ-INN 858]